MLRAQCRLRVQMSSRARPEKKKKKKQDLAKTEPVRWPSTSNIPCYSDYVLILLVKNYFAQCYGLRPPYGLRFSRSCVFFCFFFFEPVRCPEPVRCSGPVRWPWPSAIVPELETSPSINAKNFKGFCLHNKMKGKASLTPDRNPKSPHSRIGQTSPLRQHGLSLKVRLWGCKRVFLLANLIREWIPKSIMFWTTIEGRQWLELTYLTRTSNPL